MYSKQNNNMLYYVIVKFDLISDPRTTSAWIDSTCEPLLFAYFSEKATSEETPSDAQIPGLELDEEGYVIRKDSDSVHSGKNEDSDSDSDTDSGKFFLLLTLI